MEKFMEDRWEDSEKKYFDFIDSMDEDTFEEDEQEFLNHLEEEAERYDWERLQETL